VLLERIRDYGSISAAARSGSDSQSVNRAELDRDQFFECSHILRPLGRVKMPRVSEAFGTHGEDDRVPDVFATTRGEVRRTTDQ